MPRAIVTSRNAFPAVLALTVGISILPPGALGWTGFLAEVFGKVLTPFAVAGNWTGEAIYPPRLDLGSGLSADARELAQQLDELERLYRAEQAKVIALQEQLEQIQKVPPETLRVPVQRLIARVGIRAATESNGTVNLDRGSAHGVKVGSIAVFDGNNLLGRVIRVSSMQADLLPVTNPQTQLIVCAVLPKDKPEATIAEAPRVLLMPRDDGLFSTQVDKTKVIRPGDEVVLLDDAWPACAQAVRVGFVDDVSSSEREPLLNTITVRPKYLVSQVAQVVLKIEMTDQNAASASSGASQ